jgi:uncharacterized membrane protein
VRFGLLLPLVSSVLFLSVQAQAPFTMSVYPDRIVLGTKSGFKDWFTVTVLAGQGSNGTVFLSVSGVPDGVAAIFRDRGSYLTSLAIFATYLEATSSPDARLGNYTLTVSAASQGPAVFYAVATRVTLTVQEIGQPRTMLEGNRTRLTSSAAGGQYSISSTILALAAGIALGSVTTYILVRKKAQPA